jgi:hypothetical protein
MARQTNAELRIKDMSKNPITGNRLVIRLAVTLTILVVLFSFASYSPQADTFRMSFVEMTGADGGKNNVVFAFDRYVLIAPYAPTGPIQENGDLSQLDNHYLYVVDTKKPGVVLKKDLTAFENSDHPRTVYYPTKLVFDPETQNVFVRGTRFEQKEGEIREIEVVVHVHLNLTDNGKPAIDQTVVSFDVKGVGGEEISADAPIDIALGRQGSLLTFNNGASIFTYNVDHGYLYQVDIVNPSEYGPDNNISYLNVDADTNVLSVCANKKVTDDGGVTHYESGISFYRLIEDGTVTLLKQVSSGDLPKGAAFTPGSNVAIYSDPDKSNAEYALFVTSDGSLCQVDLDADGTSGSVRQLLAFAELAQQELEDASPCLVKYDPLKRVVGIVSKGYRIQISRPVNGRRGISRPVNAQVLTGQPVLAMAKFGKKGRVGSENVFLDAFRDQGGLSELISWQDDHWLLATYSGKLFSISATGSFEDATPESLGEIGSRIYRLDYLTSRNRLVAVQSCAVDEGGAQITEPGSVVVAELASQSESFLTAAAQMIVPAGSPLISRTPAIRRPCNLKR